MIDIADVEDQFYNLVGCMIGHAIIHEGQMPNFFGDITYAVMAGTVQPTLGDIMDDDLRELIQSVSLNIY